ncbi:MAG: hypothetical protein MK180_05080 [Rhodobacteraceae bacterium]|nr:hypothetical protein [Paracoccaceae bacterium]
MRGLILLLTFAAAAPAFAQGIRDGDTVLSDDEMRLEVRGSTHTFFDGGQSFFSVTDSYSYTYPDGGVAHGRYEIREDGVVCTFFNHGFERCDTYVRNDGRLVLIDGTGVRFPVQLAESGQAS